MSTTIIKDAYIVIANDAGGESQSTVYVLRHGGEAAAKAFLADHAPADPEEIDENGMWFHPKQDDWFWVWQGPVEVRVLD